MSTTLTQLAQHLDNREWNYQLDEENDRIVTGVHSDNVENFLISIQLDEDGEFLHFVAPQLLTADSNCVFIGKLFQTLLVIQYEVKMIRFEYDPTDGEIKASIELPLEDAELTEQQFNRALSSLINLVESAMPRIKEVLSTGIDPGKKKLGEQLLEAMPEGMLDLIEQAILTRHTQ